MDLRPLKIMSFGDNSNKIRPMVQKLNPTSLINSFEDWVTSKRTQNSRIQIWDLHELYCGMSRFCRVTTSASPLGTPKSGHHQIDPKFCPALPSRWTVWILRSPRGQKVDLIASIPFFSSNRGKLQWGSLYGLGTNPLK